MDFHPPKVGLSYRLSLEHFKDVTQEPVKDEENENGPDAATAAATYLLGTVSCDDGSN
ncbi:hypothetical protein GCM10011361_02990 [Muriicola marianensis]|uniref:Uncharacterized protein n=1 Tax=Muriicola marianensis TaxID=1324801 RepID=A0ABQ1QPI1_9FLAO|nr:hypothetical protein GCM10011361_02990 [Muriicola marianensis]